MALAQRLESSDKEGEPQQQTSGDHEDMSLVPPATIDLTEHEQEEAWYIKKIGGQVILMPTSG